MTETTYKTADLFSHIMPTTWIAGMAGSPFSHTAQTANAYHYGEIADLVASVSPEYDRAIHFTSEAWDASGVNASWYGASMAGAIELARNGWRDGARKAEALRAGLQAAIPQLPRLSRYDVAGAVPSVARAIAGNPMNMRRMAPAQTARRPVLTLVCHINAPSSTESRDMLRHAIAMSACVDLLEDSGFRCELIGACRAVQGTFGVETVFRIKAADQPVNLPVVAFSLGHPSVLRRLAFAIRSLKENKAILSSYGSSVAFAPGDRPDDSVFIAPPVFRIGDNLSPVRYFHAICDALRKQGCPGIPAPEDMPKAEG